MRGPTPAVAIRLTRQQRRRLERVVRKATAPHRLVERARIVLMAADGRRNASIARDLGVARNTVRLWRSRWATLGEAGLEDRARPGRPPIYDAATRAVVTSIACSLPSERGLALSRLSLLDVRMEAAKLVKPCPSVSTIHTWLQEDAIRPWTHRSWVTPRDPHFFEKAAPALDLYERRWKGKPLGVGDVVVCADEKTCIQVLERVVPLTSPGPGRPTRVEHEYVRKGVLVYQAALIVGTGRVRGQCVSSNTAAAFRALVDTVLGAEPCRSASRVFWITDNGGAHHPKSFPAWLAEHHPKAVSVFLPVHASWLDQAEIYFSILQKKALTPLDVVDADGLRDRILGFERRYNRTARPFRWGFTRRDLRRVLEGLGATPSRRPSDLRGRGRHSRRRARATRRTTGTPRQGELARPVRADRRPVPRPVRVRGRVRV